MGILKILYNSQFTHLLNLCILLLIYTVNSHRTSKISPQNTKATVVIFWRDKVPSISSNKLKTYCSINRVSYLRQFK